MSIWSDVLSQLPATQMIGASPAVRTVSGMLDEEDQKKMMEFFKSPLSGGLSSLQGMMGKLNPLNKFKGLKGFLPGENGGLPTNMMGGLGALMSIPGIGETLGRPATNTASGAMTGAQFGSMVAPGVGTAIGAGVGGLLGLLGTGKRPGQYSGPAPQQFRIEDFYGA